MADNVARPYRVMRQLNSTNYVVQKSPRSKAIIVHADRLKPFNGDQHGGIWHSSLSAGAAVSDEPVSASPAVRPIVHIMIRLRPSQLAPQYKTIVRAASQSPSRSKNR